MYKKDREFIKLLEFLYQKRQKGITFCFTGIGRTNWNNIQGYNTKYDVIKQTNLNESELVKMFNNKRLIKDFIKFKPKEELKLLVGLTNKGIQYYKKIKEERIWVKYKNYNGNYKKENKNSNLIYKYKFNHKYHKKMFFKNIIRQIKKTLKL